MYMYIYIYMYMYMCIYIYIYIYIYSRRSGRYLVPPPSRRILPRSQGLLHRKHPTHDPVFVGPRAESFGFEGRDAAGAIHPSILPAFLPSVPPLYVHCITLGSASCIPTAMQNQPNAQLTATSATSSSCPLGRLSETLTTRRQAQDGNRRVERPQRTSTRMHH